MPTRKERALGFAARRGVRASRTLDRPTRPEHGARGTAAAEFALMLPLLLIIVLGAIDWGWYFFVRSVAVNAAREGARTGTLYTADLASTSNAEEAALAYLAAAGLSRATGAGGPASVDSGIDLVRVDPDGTQVDNVWVTVQYRAGSLTGFLSYFIPAQVNVRAEMRR